MKKKIMLLILVIPLVFIVGLLSIGKVAGIYVDIPASGIHILTTNDHGFIDIDLASYNNDTFIKAQVEPTYTSNKDYSYEISPVGENKQCNIDIADDGRLSIFSDGKARISVVSKDKGFRDSVILQVHSSKVFKVEPTLTNIAGDKVEIISSASGYETTIQSGLYDFNSLVYPKELVSTVDYISENENILEINKVTGEAKAKLSGVTHVKAICKDGINDGVVADILVTVTPSASNSGILINGLENNKVQLNKDAKVAKVLFEITGDSTKEIVPVGDGLLNFETEKIKDNQYIGTFTFSDVHNDTLPIYLSLGGATNKSELIFDFTDFSLSVVNGYHLDKTNDNILQRNLSQVTYIALGEPYDDTIRYEFETINNGVIEILDNNGLPTCNIKALKLGKTSLFVNAYKGTELIKSETKYINVIRGLNSIEFEDNAKTYGIEQILAVPDTEIKDNQYVDYNKELKIRMNYGEEKEYYNGLDLNFMSLDSTIIKPYPTINSFFVESKGKGVTSIRAEWKYNNYFGVDVSANITLRGVDNGVLIRNDSELLKATTDGRAIVLDNDISLGHKGMTEDEVASYVKTKKTTYDWKFYENKAQDKVNARPSIKYLVEFNNDVYGNGYEINADNITTAGDITSTPYFSKGPLDFVAILSAAVKAQDNAVFIANKKGINIDNVVLKGCSDESLYEDGTFNLSNLNYIGTTLDVFKDCNIVNSRISNGRTVVRIFSGDNGNKNPIVKDVNEINVNEQKLNVKIESTILSNAREFILKIGSNLGVLAIDNHDGTITPYRFKKQDGTYYYPTNDPNAINQASGKDNNKDKYFMDNYVLTNVTLKNSVLTTSGLFSVGLESHFAGEMLSGVTGIKVKNWEGLAATSFGSILNLEGDVRLLDWKKLKNVDSSTLIETTPNAEPFLTLNVSKMIEKATNVKPEYKELIADVNNEPCVHGGIAMYGGGPNYSSLVADCLTSEHLTRYNVNLSILATGITDSTDPLYLQGTMLPKAAGEYDFAFYMYNNKSKNNYASQMDSINDGSAYKVPIAKI